MREPHDLAEELLRDFSAVPADVPSAPLIGATICTFGIVEILANSMTGPPVFSVARQRT
jgi:hypothetical protein